jgi:hypothetical protein
MPVQIQTCPDCAATLFLPAIRRSRKPRPSFCLPDAHVKRGDMEFRIRDAAMVRRM